MEIRDKETNDMHTRFSSSRSTRRTAAVGALIVLASSLLCLNAATVKGRGVLIGPSFHAELDDKVQVTVSNLGRRPIGIQVLLLDLTDFEKTTPGAQLIGDLDVVGGAQLDGVAGCRPTLTLAQQRQTERQSWREGGGGKAVGGGLGGGGGVPRAGARGALQACGV